MKRTIMAIFLITYIGINAQVPFCVAPLESGNLWVYRDVTSPVTTWRSVYQVMDSTVIINNKQYSVIRTYETSERHKPQNISYHFIMCRYDPTDSTYKYYDEYNEFENSEYKYYKKGSVPGDRWKTKNPRYHDSTIYNTVLDSATLRVFQKIVVLTRYIIATDSLVANSYEYWTDELGMLKRGVEGTLYYLLGCVVNGELYGDTLRTFTDVFKEEAISPEKFRLYQNYPNPFNPSTKIKFSVPNYSFVSLRVYNILGKEIESLVNEFKDAGVYETEFNGESLPSGIYVCTLISGKHKEHIKISLLK